MSYIIYQINQLFIQIKGCFSNSIICRWIGYKLKTHNNIENNNIFHQHPNYLIKLLHYAKILLIFSVIGICCILFIL